MGITGFAIYKSNGYPDRSASNKWSADNLNNLNLTHDQRVNLFNAKSCRLADDPNLKQVIESQINYCLLQLSNNPPNAVIIGDSHSEDKFYGLSLLDRSKSWLLLGNSACPLTWSLASGVASANQLKIKPEAQVCSKKFESIIKYILNNKNIEFVAISFMQIKIIESGNDSKDLRLISKINNPFIDTSFKNLQEIQLLELDYLFKALQNSGKKIIFIVDTPHLPVHPKDCLHNKESRCEIDRKTYENFSRENIWDSIDALQKKYDKVNVVNLTDAFCLQKKCIFIDNNQVLYKDHHHLSPFGSLYFGAHFLDLQPTIKQDR